jgi:hypothetical protein
VAGTHIRHVNGKTFIVKNPTRGTGIGDANARPTRSGRRRRKGSVSRDQRQAAFEKGIPRHTKIDMPEDRPKPSGWGGDPVTARLNRENDGSLQRGQARQELARQGANTEARVRQNARQSERGRASKRAAQANLALNRRSQQNELERLAGKDRELAARIADADRQMQTATPDEQRRLLKRNNRPHRQRRKLAGR